MSTRRRFGNSSLASSRRLGTRSATRFETPVRRPPGRATEVGRKLFPPNEAALIAELIRRDLPFYDASISPDFVAGMNQFARDIGILQGDIPYDKVVATRFAGLWQS